MKAVIREDVKSPKLQKERKLMKYAHDLQFAAPSRRSDQLLSETLQYSCILQADKPKAPDDRCAERRKKFSKCRIRAANLELQPCPEQEQR